MSEESEAIKLKPPFLVALKYLQPVGEDQLYNIVSRGSFEAIMEARMACRGCRLNEKRNRDAESAYGASCTGIGYRQSAELRVVREQGENYVEMLARCLMVWAENE